MENLVDTIQRLQPKMGFDDIATRRSENIVAAINSSFGIGFDKLADCLLLMWRNHEKCDKAHKIAFEICQRNERIEPHDSVIVAYHIANLNKRVGDKEWNDKILDQYKRFNGIPYYPSASMSDNAGQLILKILRDNDFPDGVLDNTERLECYVMSATTCAFFQDRTEAVKAMVDLARNDFWPEQISLSVKLKAMELAATLTMRDTQLGHDARSLVDRFSTRATLAENPSRLAQIVPLASRRPGAGGNDGLTPMS